MRILPITDKQVPYAESIRDALAAKGLRAGIDASADKLGAKIRAGTVEKVPYLLVAGGRDEAAGVVSVRRRGEGDLGAMKLEAFIERVDEELKNKQ